MNIKQALSLTDTKLSEKSTAGRVFHAILRNAFEGTIWLLTFTTFFAWIFSFAVNWIVDTFLVGDLKTWVTWVVTIAVTLNFVILYFFSLEFSENISKYSQKKLAIYEWIIIIYNAFNMAVIHRILGYQSVVTSYLLIMLLFLSMYMLYRYSAKNLSKLGFWISMSVTGLAIDILYYFTLGHSGAALIQNFLFTLFFIYSTNRQIDSLRKFILNPQGRPIIPSWLSHVVSFEIYIDFYLAWLFLVIEASSDNG